LARDAKAQQPGLKVLFATGYARSALDQAPEGERALEVLTKPFGVEDLAKRVRAIIG
jgi:DNA-binding LytR/AlgR family response regulator